MWLYLVALLLHVVDNSAAYNRKDPAAKHTDQAIKYDQNGQQQLALAAFRAAVKYETTRPKGERLANLGVICMRMQMWEDAKAAMAKAMAWTLSAEGASDKQTIKHVQSNWDALMSHLDYHGIPRPRKPTNAAKTEATNSYAEPATVDEVKEQIEALLKEHNPTKVAELPALLAKYKGKEKQLLHKMKEKYGVSPKHHQQYKLQIPRVTAAELAANKTLMSGHWAYVLTGEVEKWPAMANWNLDYLVRRIPDEWVDYYPYNMYESGNKPYVQLYREAMPKFRQRTADSKYMQLRLSLPGWEALLPDLATLPREFWTEAEWIDQCMSYANGTRDDSAIDNFFRVNQWNFLLIGEKGTGIFFHKDHLAAASWQAAVVGRKKWVLCPFTENRHLSTDVFTFKPDYTTQAGQNFGRALCGMVTVHPGEILYYPSYWWHQTRCLDTPTIGLTGLMVGVEEERIDLDFRKVHEQFYHDLLDKCKKCWKMDGSKKRHCDDISLKWPGAAPPASYEWCHNYLKRCYKLWDQKDERDRAQKLLRVSKVTNSWKAEF